MMPSENESKKTEITIFKAPPAWVLGGAFLIMLAAKVFNYSDLSWWIVTAPLWGPIAICLGFLLLFAAVAIIGFTIFLVSALIVEIFKAVFLRQRKNRKENDDDYRLHS